MFELANIRNYTQYVTSFNYIRGATENVTVIKHVFKHSL